MKTIMAWLRRQFSDKFTVACDRAPHWQPGINESETLFHVSGLFMARRTARRWVASHPEGQARIIVGHTDWTPRVDVSQDPNWCGAPRRWYHFE